MAATSVQLAPTNNTDANFRLWGKAISDALAAGGWVQTSDTGQINWTTVSAPPSVTTFQGYEIWRSNDAGGGLTEFYLKIEYGSGTTSSNNCAVRITIGWATNGSGTLTGVISDAITSGITSSSSSANSTSLFWSNFSTAPGRAQIFMFTGDGVSGSNSKGWAFSIERLRNASFEQTNNILILAFRNNTNNETMVNQVVSPSLAYPTSVVSHSTSIDYPLTAQIIQANAGQSGKAGVSLIFGQMGGLTAPSNNVFGGTVTSFGAVQTNDIKITSMGVERNYIINAASPYFSKNSTAGTAAFFITRFE